MANPATDLSGFRTRGPWIAPSWVARTFLGNAPKNPTGYLGWLRNYFQFMTPDGQATVLRFIAARAPLHLLDALSDCPAGRKVMQQLYQTRFGPIAFPSGAFIHAGHEFDFYASIGLLRGSGPAVAALGGGRLTLVALRRQSSTLANHGKGSYDDLVAVLKGAGPLRQAHVFPICTEPGAQYSQRASTNASTGNRVDSRYTAVKYKKTDGVDINKDGIKDAGRLVEGTYAYFEKKGGHLNARAFIVKVKQVAQRDTDGDGKFTSDDPDSIDPGGAGTSMYIHQGGKDTVLEPNTWSAGCQTIPQNRYKTFLKSVGPANASFHYVLVNCA